MNSIIKTVATARIDPQVLATTSRIVFTEKKVLLITFLHCNNYYEIYFEIFNSVQAYSIKVKVLLFNRKSILYQWNFPYPKTLPQ